MINIVQDHSMQTRGKFAVNTRQICSYRCSKYPTKKRQIGSKEATMLQQTRGKFVASTR
jgi:hypothetical protein